MKLLIYVSRGMLHMKQHQKQGERNKVGAIGERIAADYLKDRGFDIIDTNYLKKWGEIDIVTRETSVIRFIEVKTVSYGTRESLYEAISHGTYRPEENVHYSKINRLNRTIESWITENNYEGEWEIDVVAVRLAMDIKYATVNYLRNIILD